MKATNWLTGTSLSITAVLVMPLCIVAFSLFSIDTQLWSHLLNTVFAEYVTNSLILAISVGLGSIVIGSYLAYIMVNYRFIGHRVLSWLILLPLAMPAYIIAYTYTGLLDFTGPVQSTLRQLFSLERGEYWFWDVRSLSGAIIMMILVFYPYVYILARTAFSEQSSSFEQVSALAKRTRWQHIRQVALPLARPAILTGASLAMMEALADYGTVAYFGVSTFSTGIFRTWFGMGDIQGAAQLSTVLCMFVLVLLVIEKRSRKDAQQYQTSLNKKLRAKKTSGVKGIVLCLLCLLPVLFGFVIPFTQLLIWSINYADIGDWPAFFDVVKNSFTLALMGAVIIVIIALIVSYAKRMQLNKIRTHNGLSDKFSPKSVSASERILSLGYALPGIVIAVGVLILSGWFDQNINRLTMTWFDYRPGLILSGGLGALLIAYSIRFVSVALQNTETGMARIPNKVDNAALSLQGSAWTMLRRIHIPMLSGSLISASLLVFVDILKELPATLVLRPFNFNTLAVRAFELASDERLIDAALPAISIVLVGLIPVILLTRQLNKLSA
uniref:ABC transporter permease n=1 Tax=Ningiella ruwaisensis TaxID=2364274 RepID=UPI0010A0986C|nr:iron ABC transporter permease [Ningiella ruwaisensis]